MGEGGGENSPFPLLLKWESEALFLCLKLEKQSRSISPPHRLLPLWGLWQEASAASGAFWPVE